MTRPPGVRELGAARRGLEHPDGRTPAREACSRCGADPTGGLGLRSGPLCPACCDAAYEAVFASLERDND